MNSPQPAPETERPITVDRRRRRQGVLELEPIPACAQHIDLDPLRWLGRHTQRPIVTYDVHLTPARADAPAHAPAHPSWDVIGFSAVVVSPSGHTWITNTWINSGRAHADDVTHEFALAPTLGDAIGEIRDLMRGAVVVCFDGDSAARPGLRAACERDGFAPLAMDVVDLRALLALDDANGAGPNLWVVAAQLGIYVNQSLRERHPTLVGAAVAAEVVGRVGALRFLASRTAPPAVITISRPTEVVTDMVVTNESVPSAVDDAVNQPRVGRPAERSPIAMPERREGLRERLEAAVIATVAEQMRQADRDTVEACARQARLTVTHHGDDVNGDFGITVMDEATGLRARLASKRYFDMCRGDAKEKAAKT